MSSSSASKTSEVSFPASIAASSARTEARTATDARSLASHPAYR